MRPTTLFLLIGIIFYMFIGTAAIATKERNRVQAPFQLLRTEATIVTVTVAGVVLNPAIEP